MRADPYLDFLPPTIRSEVEAWGIEFALNFTLSMTREFIPQYYFDVVRVYVCLHRQLACLCCREAGAWRVQPVLLKLLLVCFVVL